MNKIIALAALGSLSFFGVQAEENQNWFDSFYLAAGIGGDFVNNDDMTEDCNYSYTKDMGGLAIEKSARKLKDRKTNRVMGSFIVGAGKTFDHGIYAGLEGSIDIAQSKKHDLQIEHAPDSVEFKVKTNGKIKNDGVSYSLGARFGLVSNNVLVYIKPSIQFNKTSIEGYTNEYNTSIFVTENTGKSGYGSKNKAFALALGVERAFCNNNFSVRLEGEYVFPVTVKAESPVRLNDAASNKPLVYTAKTKVRKVNVRLLGVYNFKY